jgi:hypothetical protein
VVAERTRQLLQHLAASSGRAQDKQSPRVEGASPFDPPISDEEAVELVGMLDLEELKPSRPALLDLIETAPGWPLWACLKYPTNSGIVELRLRLMARGFRPVEM